MMPNTLNMTKDSFRPSTKRSLGIRPSVPISCIHSCDRYNRHQLERNRKVAANRFQISRKLHSFLDNFLPSKQDYVCIRRVLSNLHILHTHQNSHSVILYYRCTDCRLSRMQTSCSVCCDCIRQLQTTACNIGAD